MHIRGLWESVLALLQWVAPFAFVFCLISASQGAMNGGKKTPSMAWWPR